MIGRWWHLAVDPEGRGDLVARGLHLADPRPVGTLPCPSVDEERAEVGVIPISLFLHIHLGERGLVPFELFPLLLHPGDRLVAAPESVAGNPGVVIGVEVVVM